jgi:hypothetical protein
MKEIYWKELNVFEKIIFCLGWTSAFRLVFWIALTIHNSIEQEKKFWNPKSFGIVYIFGWIQFVTLIIFLLGVLIYFIEG